MSTSQTLCLLVGIFEALTVCWAVCHSEYRMPQNLICNALRRKKVIFDLTKMSYKEWFCELFHFETSQPCSPARRLAVVMEEPPVSMPLANAVVSCPPCHGLEQHSAILEWPVWTFAHGITKQMAVACGIAEDVFAIAFVHP